MLQLAKSFCGLTFLVTTLTASGAASLSAQSAAPRPWTVTAAFTGFRTNSAGNWVYGPALGIRRDFGRHWGMGLRAALPVLDAEPYSDDGAVALDLGPTLTFAGDKGEIGLSAGPTAFLVGDRGELSGGGIGAFASGHGTAWLTGSLGLTASVDVRFAGGDAVYPSLSAGLAMRF